MTSRKQCDALHPGNGLVWCTRPVGHEGEHVHAEDRISVKLPLAGGYVKNRWAA